LLISPNRLDGPLLQRLLHSALGPSYDLSGWRVVREDRDYAVITVTLAASSRDVVIKLAGPRAALTSDFDRTAAIAGLVRSRTDVATFDVLAVDVTYRAWPWRYIVMTRVPGVAWREVRSARNLYTALGEAVGRLHGIRFPACGEIGPDGHVLGGDIFHTALVERARRRIANPKHAALFVASLRERTALFDGMHTGALCHDDLNPHNILVTDTSATGPAVAVIDFDSAWAGCQESDLARLELWRGLIGDGFWEAYRANASLSPLYPERRPIYQLLWCLEYARSTPQHIADTARVCAELGIEPVTFKVAMAPSSRSGG
jgi:aminoglycoside phosphotransferase (APT) family kinase protein